MNVPMLDLKAQYETIKGEIIPAITDVCEKQALCLGPAVVQFEENVAKYCGSNFAIGVSSGSDALLASLMSMGIGQGDEVIAPAFTFVATTGAIARVGATPVFVDINKDTFNIDPAKIESAITPKTKAIIPVHLFGQLADMDAILEIANKHDLLVIEDAAQSIGASQKGIKAGNFGDCGCFSFYPSKNLGAFGDGGLITTNDKSLCNKIKMVRNHGQSGTYEYELIGGNFRLDGIQGAVLDIKLKYLEKWSQKRRDNAAIYNNILSDSEVKTPFIAENNISIYNQYTIKAPKRDELKQHLINNNIGCAVYYPNPLHLEKCFKDLGYKIGDLPETDRASKEVLSIPVYPELSTEQIEYVAKTILSFYK